MFDIFKGIFQFLIFLIGFVVTIIAALLGGTILTLFWAVPVWMIAVISIALAIIVGALLVELSDLHIEIR
ncbi:hypothetical protein [Phyllobacterium myrsinacearum]|uniref:Uncharacterized protein (DUF983 family) n=1 Tax=Phyllobacterium myrsinacearum TaxID=28101 RepID=A0A839EWL4_9HYPH|nr:hypothetical protein [Phyllobacterium myrsinacearum]MBA8881696.1 uncharacterized protein (DUF983 family) [Phyllobacterium myrsinacearum]